MARKDKSLELNRRDFLKGVGCGICMLQLAACGGSTGLQIEEWPIAENVFTTAQQQILPIGLTASTPQINPSDLPLYAQYGYSLWQVGPGLSHVKRTELAPDYNGARKIKRLLSFFAITDVHIADKESPAQLIYPGWSASYGPSSANYSSAYTPVMLSTPHVLDAAVQTINALHRVSPFDFGISLGDNANNTQYNELRWFIDVLDGKIITPSSGAHAGAYTIDYQKPFRAAGLDKAIPWYQVIGNHDQFFIGWAYQDTKLLQAHLASTILDMKDDFTDWHSVDETGAYMGAVNGLTPYGDIIGAGPEASFPVPPKVVSDENRRSLATSTSTTLNWMDEFFSTSSSPVGHGFTRSNLANDIACYSFVPKSDIPIKVIALDDTVKGDSQVNYALGGLDQRRLGWLKDELQAGQDKGQLMIIAAHIPIKPQASFTDTTPFPFFRATYVTDDSLLAILHGYPNLILWISGHRHVNVVTPQPDPGGDPTCSFWEVETASFHDFPQQFRTFDIHLNSDSTISIVITNVDPAVAEGSPAAKSRGYAIGVARIFGATPVSIADTTSHAYNAELVVQLSPAMQAKIADFSRTFSI